MRNVIKTLGLLGLLAIFANAHADESIEAKTTISNANLDSDVLWAYAGGHGGFGGRGGHGHDGGHRHEGWHGRGHREHGDWGRGGGWGRHGGWGRRGGWGSYGGGEVYPVEAPAAQPVNGQGPSTPDESGGGEG